MDERQKTELFLTSCIGCAVRIVAFRDDEDEEMHSVYITWLSEHSHLYQDSWRRRLRLAWQALRGKPIGEIDLDTTGDVVAFDRAWRSIFDWVGERNLASRDG